MLVKKVSLTELLLGSWLGVGLVSTVAGWCGWWYPWLGLSLLLPLSVMTWVLGRSITQVWLVWPSLSGSVRVGVIVLAFIWLLHALGILVPETGFDAVWYHLPIVDRFATVHQLVYIPEYYQSLNPFFSDGIFLLGYMLWGEVGTKVVAFAFAITLVMVSDALVSSRLNQEWRLLFLLSVSLIQVVTWQASSFYIDVAKAVWEIGAIWCLVGMIDAMPSVLGSLSVRQKWWLLELILLVGASLATKTFSLLLLPFFVGMITYYFGFATGGVVLLSLEVPLPYYLFNLKMVGNAWYSLELHIAKLREIGGESQPLDYFLLRLSRLPTSPWWLLVARDYVSPLLVLFAPLTTRLSRSDLSDPWFSTLSLFALYQWLVWWFIPPLSTRYALSGFVCLMAIMCRTVALVAKQQSEYRLSLQLTAWIVVLFLLLPRLNVASRQMPYILGLQTKQAYLEQFFDETIDSHLKRWHGLD